MSYSKLTTEIWFASLTALWSIKKGLMEAAVCQRYNKAVVHNLYQNLRALCALSKFISKDAGTGSRLKTERNIRGRNEWNLAFTMRTTKQLEYIYLHRVNAFIRINSTDNNELLLVSSSYLIYRTINIRTVRVQGGTISFVNSNNL